MFYSNDLGKMSTEITEHIDYIDRIRESYFSGRGNWQAIDASLGRIKEKQKDKLLNMSVIGEFSSGKSTFINALLRSKLLVSSSLQGTTVTNTVIEYGEQYGAAVISEDGEITDSFLSADAGELAKKIAASTTDPEKGRYYSSVRMTVPSDNLKNNFRIIDTPGTNATEAWHEDVTKRAIRELSDVSVVLVDSTQMLPESFCDFVIENLSDVITQCAFVFTKFDIIPEDEREMFLDVAVSKVKSAFGVDAPLVLPYSAKAILGGDENADMYKESIESEKKLLAYMAERRVSAQLKKLVVLTDELYGAVKTDMEKISSECDSKLALLMKSKHAPLEPFVEKQLAERAKSYEQSCEVLQSEFVNALCRIGATCMDEIISDIRDMNDVDSVKRYANNTVPDKCRQTANAMLVYCNKRENESIKKAYASEISVFRREFTEQFRSMRLLQIGFKHIKSEAFSSISDTKGMNDVTNDYINELNSKQQGNMLGGAAAGAVIGSVVPGIGTVVGAVAGFLLGGLFGPSLDKVKTDTVNNLTPELKKYFYQIITEAENRFARSVSVTAENMRKEIMNYLYTYKSRVDEMINEETERKKQLDAKKSNVEKELDAISRRKGMLSALGHQIDSIGLTVN